MFLEVTVHDNNNVFGSVTEVTKNVRNHSKNIKPMPNAGKHVTSGNAGKVTWTQNSSH